MTDTTAAGPHVQRLWFDKENTGRTVTENDLKHARHADECPICDDNARCSVHLEGQIQATEEARCILAVGITRLLASQEEGRKYERAGVEGGKPPMTVEQIESYLKRLNASAMRAWKNREA